MSVELASASPARRWRRIGSSEAEESRGGANAAALASRTTGSRRLGPEVTSRRIATSKSSDSAAVAAAAFPEGDDVCRARSERRWGGGRAISRSDDALRRTVVATIGDGRASEAAREGEGGIVVLSSRAGATSASRAGGRANPPARARELLAHTKKHTSHTRKKLERQTCNKLRPGWRRGR